LTERKGKLIGIGVGPGDTELLTIKAVKILKTVPIICSPKSAPDKESIALSIIKPILEKRKKESDKKESDRKEEDLKKNDEDKNESLKILEPVFPMIEDGKTLEKHWDEASSLIAKYLNEGLDVAFITLGDPSIYSTFSYVQKRLDEYEIEMVPGVNSFTACASSISKPLVEKDEILMIIPKIDDRLETLLKNGNNFVLMKTSRNTEELEDIIHNQDGEKEIISVQNCTMENEEIIYGFPKNKPYLTTTIVKLKK